jgi:hypothetical protein
MNSAFLDHLLSACSLFRLQLPFECITLSLNLSMNYVRRKGSVLTVGDAASNFSKIDLKDQPSAHVLALTFPHIF